MSKIEVKNLNVIFGKHTKKALTLLEKGSGKDDILKETGCTIGVNGAEFNIENGELFVIMGLSGSGKSTLLRCLNRLIDPTSGIVTVDGNDVTAAEEDRLRELRRTEMGMVFQHFGLLPHRTVASNVAFGLEIQGKDPVESREKALQVIKTVGLDGYEDMMTGELSGGMQQRVGLARALANDPEILLMDEAFSALDPLIRKNMQDELLQLQEKVHKTIVFITHDLDEALKLGDRIAIMKDGKIVQIGTPEDIITNPANRYVENFTEDVNRANIVTASTIMLDHVEKVRRNDGPQTALHKMKKIGISVLPVVGEGDKFLGFIRDTGLEEMAKSSAKEFKPFMCSTEDTNAVYPDTPASEMLPFFIESSLDLAVVDENNKLLGIVPHSAVVSEMIGKHPEELEKLIREGGVDYAKV
ncbi:MAG: glycine betaine/L-proline ABC transporter ATP-binding protein [Fibrobacterota bacterium]